MEVSASTLVHRLLFDALTEIRDEAATSGNKLVYHLSDMFHQIVLQLEQAAALGDSTAYDRAIESLKETARRKGCAEWLDRHLQQIEARIHASSPVT